MESNRELHRLIAEYVKGVTVDVETVRKHVIRPPNLDAGFSDHGNTASNLNFFPRPPGNEPEVLDIPTFGANLNAALTDRVAGYVAQLRQQGQIVFETAWQYAKRSQDGAQFWAPDVPMHIASVSKLLTAMAMTRLMAAQHISPDAQIIDYLPNFWTKGPNIEYIVFRNLFNHTSGLTAPDVVDFNIMQSAIAGGISLDPNATEHLGNYHYQNLNYALCRVLLPVIDGTINKNAVFPFGLNALFWDYVTIGGYERYLQANVFAPSNVTGATLDQPKSAALGYWAPNDSGHGWNPGNLEEIAGGDSWHVSVSQLLDVMGEFRRGGGIVSPAAAQAMLDNGFGVDPFGNSSTGLPASEVTPAGTIYCKPGEWYDKTEPNTNQGVIDYSRDQQSVAYFLPQEMELVVFANSPVAGPRGTTQSFPEVVTQVYLNSLTLQPPVLA